MQAVEQGEVYVTPHGGEGDYAEALHEAEMRVIAIAPGVIEVNDVLHGKPYRFGDRSLVRDPVADDYVVASWEVLGHTSSVRQLTNTEKHETKQGTGRWSRAQHMLSAAALTALYGGTPVEIMQMATHDAAHRLGSHRTDDLLTKRGLENAHDDVLLDVMRRNGFLDALIVRGLCDENGVLKDQDGVSVETLYDLSCLPEGFINQPGKKCCLETERAQYIAQEGAIWIYGPTTMREALSHLYRIPDSAHGDHLVFDDVDAARTFEIAQVRCNTEHWADRCNDIIDELIMTADRSMFLSRHPELVDIVRYYPGDVLNGLEEDWQRWREELAEKEPFVSALLKVATTLAAQQRNAHAGFDDSKNRYTGPVLPDWVTIQESLLAAPVRDEQKVVSGHSKKLKGTSIVIEMMPGKVRSINPWVKLPGQDMRRIEDLDPSLAEFRETQSQWTGDCYDAVIDLDHPALGLTRAEKGSIKKGLARIQEEWPLALARPAMPDELYKQRLQKSAERYRDLGRLSVVLGSARALHAAS